MTCERCGAPATGGRCRDCEQQEHVEAQYGTAADDVGVDAEDDEWEVDQQGLGDRDPAGQARLDGGIAREGEDGDDDDPRPVADGGYQICTGCGNPITRGGATIPKCWLCLWERDRPEREFGSGQS